MDALGGEVKRDFHLRKVNKDILKALTIIITKLFFVVNIVAQYKGHPVVGLDMINGTLAFLGNANFRNNLAHYMMSLPMLRDSRDFSPYSSSAGWADEDAGDSNTSLSALSEADVEGPAVPGLAHLTGLKKEDMEERPAADVEGPAVPGLAGVRRTACLTGLKNK
ncbi:hypothetical protein E2C01_017498 [Portunus trituberculatus]|uniref:Uncharacterized protein n=1 Tax=Portunus trituberculatus TaxID=210409 RepID=A0A5B7DT08_PORTR|nr:hypothetical protein [Portunus trituberculatus]